MFTSVLKTLTLIYFNSFGAQEMTSVPNPKFTCSGQFFDKVQALYSAELHWVEFTCLLLSPGKIKILQAATINNFNPDWGWLTFGENSKFKSGYLSLSVES